MQYSSRKEVRYMIIGVLKSRMFWIYTVTAVFVSVLFTLIRGWDMKILSTALTAAGFIVLALSFFSGWGHDRQPENLGIIEAERKEKDKMQGKISVEGIFAAAVLMIVGTLLFFL
jgi:hypothetical protein